MELLWNEREGLSQGERESTVHSDRPERRLGQQDAHQAPSAGARYYHLLSDGPSASPPTAFADSRAGAGGPVALAPALLFLFSAAGQQKAAQCLLLLFVALPSAEEPQGGQGH